MSNNNFFYRTPPLATFVVRRNTKHEKMKTRESKERNFEKKVREVGYVVLIYIYMYIVLFAFLSSTVEAGRW